MNEKLAELKRKRAQLVAEMKAIVAKETDESPMEDGDKNRFDEIKDAIDAHDQRIGRLEDMVSAEGGEEVDDSKQFESTIHKSNVLIQNKKDRSHEAKGTKAARFIIGAGIAKAHGMDAGVSFVRDGLDDAEVAKQLNATGTSAAGGLLVPQDYKQDMIDVLWAESVVRSSNPTVIPMPMGQITMPRLSSTSTATWIGESTDIPSNQPAFDQIVMTAKKLAGIVPVQNDLIRRSPLAVETIVRTQMVKQLARAEDLAFLTGTGSSFQPKGLANWALNTHSSLVAPTLNIVNNVLAAAQLDLLGNNVSDANAVLFMPPAVRSYLLTLTDSVGNYFFAPQLNAGTLFGYPVKTTTALSTNTLNATTVSTTLGATATATTNLTVASSASFLVGMQVSGTGIAAVTTITAIPDSTHITVNVATTMANSATLTGSFPTAPIILAAMDQVLLGDTLDLFADSSDVASYYDGSATVSAYQRDQTIFRCVKEVDMNVQHPAVISVTNVFNWLPSNVAAAAGALYSTQTGTYPATGSLSATIV